VRAAYVSLVVAQLLFPMTLEGGYFQKYGIDCQLNYINGSSTAVAGLASHSLDIFCGSGAAVVSAVAGGANVVLVASFLNKLFTKIMASSDVTPLTT